MSNSDPAASDEPTDRKTVAVLLSTMRSGSTLLKALLAQAPDISDLPETDFQHYARGGSIEELESLGKEPLLLLKRPAWFNEVGKYPQLPEHPRLKRIVLVRDAYANGLSLRKMFFRHVPFLQKTGLGNSFLLERYWSGVNRRLLEFAQADAVNTVLVRYEDVLKNPRGETARLFAFLGSAQTEGVETYQKPQGYEWRWGKDDGGAVIKSLRVQPPRPIDYADGKLTLAIKGSAVTQSLRRDLGYPDLP